MEAMRESWTDDRLDDFRGETSRRFDEVDRRFDEMRDEMNRRFDEVNRELRTQRGEMANRFERIEGRIYDLHRTMLWLGGSAIVTFVVGFAGVIATRL